LVLSLYLSGQSVVEIADGPIQSAMQRLGELWRHDETGIFVEHRATDICIQAVQQLRQLVEPQQPRALAVGGAPPGDPYLLPSLLAATALGAEGWQTMNLGPDTPFEALLTAVERSGPQLVWLSASVVRDAGEFTDGLRTLADRLAAREIPLVVGGRGLTAASVPDGATIRIGRTLADLVALAGAQRCGASETSEVVECNQEPV
jgi:methanogenic corrinoid protein MtbC1